MALNVLAALQSEGFEPRQMSSTPSPSGPQMQQLRLSGLVSSVQMEKRRLMHTKGC